MIENNDFVAGKQKVCSDQELEYSIKFDPPVYRQRYGRIFDTLIDERWRTKLNILCDFGCGELSFFIFVKSLNQLNHIYFVDIDEELLKENIRKVHPLTIEYIRRRTDPLQISVFAGSVADPDYHIFNVDVVTAIELIEHLYPDTLEAFPYNIFYYIQPKIVIITTPNFDFNVLFSHTKRFRHPDHKFEWTRKQFEDWANNIICRFPDYVVSFSGIGEGPDGTKHLGECSQMAVFIRKDTLDDQYILKKFSDNNCNCNLDAACKEQIGHYTEKCSCVCQCCCPNFSWGICRYNTKSKVIDIEKDGHKRSAYYKLIGQVNFPFEQDNRTEDEKMFDEFRYRIAAMGQVYGRFFVEDRERSEIPLNDLLYGNYGGYITKLELLKLLEKNNYRIEECVIEETGQSELCVIYFPMDKLTSSSEESSDFDEDDSVCYNKVEDTVSQWNDSQSDLESINEDSKNNKDLIESRETNEKTKDIIPNTQLDTGSTTPGSNVPPKAEDEEEVDFFEETSSTPSLSSDDNKVHLKRGLEKRTLFPIPLEFNKLKIDINRINELDRFRKITSGRNFFSQFLKPQAEKLRKSLLRDADVVAGPSAPLPKKRKKMKPSISNDTEDDVSTLDDMKSVTNCIIENTLNILDIDCVADKSRDGFTTAPFYGPFLPENISERFQIFEEMVDFDNGSVIDVRSKEGKPQNGFIIPRGSK